MLDRAALTGTTRLAAVIGAPVRHSLSPVICNAAFADLGLDWAYLAFEVAEGRSAGAIEAMRTLDIGGLSVTMPHKTAVAAAVDRCSPQAAALSAVNCVAWDDGELVGHNTDGDGLLAALEAEVAWRPAGRRCVVLGGGGAGRSVVAALAAAGAAEVVVVNRDPARGEAAAALAGLAGRLGAPGDITDAELVVNATSVGMAGNDGLPCDPSLLHDAQVVVDLVYQPLETPLLVEAARRGATAVGGLGMLVHQAALAIGLWTGAAPSVEVMAAAARAALAARAATPREG